MELQEEPGQTLSTWSPDAMTSFTEPIGQDSIPSRTNRSAEVRWEETWWHVIVPWSNGRLLVWASTCSDTLANSNVSTAVTGAGAVAERSGQIKEITHIWNLATCLFQWQLRQWQPLNTSHCPSLKTLATASSMPLTSQNPNNMFCRDCQWQFGGATQPLSWGHWTARKAWNYSCEINR